MELEMYYSGATSLFKATIGYASSDDGIHWTKDAANPIFEATDDLATKNTGDIVESPSVIDMGNERWLYYDYGQGNALPAVGITTASLSYQQVFLPVVVQQ